MACPINEAELKKLHIFVDVCSANPMILNLPELSFFKAFIEKMGGKVPQSDTSFRQPGPTPQGRVYAQHGVTVQADEVDTIELNIKWNMVPTIRPIPTEMPQGASRVYMNGGGVLEVKKASSIKIEETFGNHLLHLI